MNKYCGINSKKLLGNSELKMLSNAIFVLSQKALIMKLDMMLILSEINTGSLDAVERKEKMDRFEKKNKRWKFFQAERLLVLRYLIRMKKAKVLYYIDVDGVPYGFVEFGDHKFYVIINKKIIAYYNLEKKGETLPDLPLAEASHLEQYYPSHKESLKIFNGFYHYAKREDKKLKKKRKSVVQEYEQKKSIISQTINASGRFEVRRKK